MKYEPYEIQKLFEVLPIKEKFSKQDIEDFGKFPIVSSQKGNEGVIGQNSKPSFFPQNNKILTFGDHTKEIYVRNLPFSVLDNVKVLKLKEEYKDKVLLDFIILNWKPRIPSLGYARHWKIAKEVIIEIPVDNDGKFDIDSQIQFINKQDKIFKLKKGLSRVLKSINNFYIDFKMNKYLDVPLDDIFDFPETNSKITRSFCDTNEGEIPVYASSKNEKSTLGFIKNNIKKVKYYKDCLSWNRNGSVGYVFIREGTFSTNEDHRAMVIKKEYRNLLDKKFLKFEIERELLLEGFSFLNKCGADKIKKVEIKIPIKDDGNSTFDIEKQKEISNEYDELIKIRNKIKIKINSVLDTFVDLKC